jgi:hypothetical protein
MDNALQAYPPPISDMSNDIGVVTRTSWTAPADMTFDEWQRVGCTLQTVQGSINWWIGDWLNEGEKRYGETYAQAIEVTGWDISRLQIAKHVSSNVESLIRIKDLSWTHHRHVASLPPAEQEHWLNLAVQNDWSSGQLKDAIKESLRPPGPATSTNSRHKAEPLPGDYKEPEEYYAALWGVDGDAPAPQDRYEYRDEYHSDPPETGAKMVSSSGRNLDALMSSESNEWYTTPDIISAVADVMGEIDLDPCSNSHETPNVPAKCHFTKDDDGLAQVWHGKVYVNPPYGNEIPLWVAKINHEYQEGNIEQCILLVPARTDTRWFRALKKYPRCFMHGRVRFNNHENSAPFPTMLVGIGVDTDRFIRVMESLGDVYKWITTSENNI